MNWVVKFDEEFRAEFQRFPPKVQEAIVARTEPLKREGPLLGRPDADTLYGSKHTNMKALRLKVEKSEWRVAFAFDSERQAILLVAGSKAGVKAKRFYGRLIAQADERFDHHLAQMRKGKR